MKTKQVPRLKRSTTAYGLLSKVCEVILEEPRRYNQSWWIETRSVTREKPHISDSPFPACGTICCVAGWVETLAGGTFTSPHNAAGVLGLDPYQAGQLFNGGALALDTKARQGTLTYARAGVRHIRQFQKQYADELKGVVVKPGRAR